MAAGTHGSFEATDGVSIHYTVTGAGLPVVLVHSFGFDGELWSGAGLVDTLAREGRTVVAIDCRGHGRSGKPAHASGYGADRMAADVSELLDHRQVEAADLVAFSMGSFISLGLLQRERRVERAVLGGVGGAALRPRLFDGVALPAEPGADEAADLVGRLTPYLRPRVQDGRADARALVAVLRAGFSPNDKDFSSVQASVLLLSGTRDDDPGPLAAAIPGARVERVDADHAGTMDHPEFVPAIVRFLRR